MAASFVGSGECVECHTEIHAEWSESDHGNAMHPAEAGTVLGDFEDLKLEFHGLESRFFRESDQFKIETIGPDGKSGVFTIAYTFGHYPLQQYLVDIGNGHLQALNIAWDNRPQDQGGQRWYHLQADEDIDPAHPYFWTRHFQNANSRCIECHATDVKKNYDVDTAGYATRWTETGVGCEACHGPAAKHVEAARNGSLQADYSGFAKQPESGLLWTFAEGESIASPSGSRDDAYLDTCGGCHSRRATRGDVEALAPFHDSYRLALLDPGLYFSDGQIDDEVFVLGSFLQSKMQQQGVTCGNCHNPHSGKLLAQDNALCAQCHLPEVFDTARHHHHQPGSTGAECVNCHMPEKTYMTIDPRRDHSFPIPDPARSIDSDLPNACNSCHRDESPAWAVEALADWEITINSNRWASINRGLELQDSLLFLEWTNDPLIYLPRIRQASLISKLSAFPTGSAFQVAADRLSDPDPLVRRAAVIALQPAPLEVRWGLLNPMLEDQSPTVRNEVTIALAEAQAQLTGKDAERLGNSIRELRTALAYHADSPTGQVAIGNLEMTTGYPILAERAYKRALEIESTFVPALLNLADLLRSIGSDGEAREYLLNALDVAPDSASTNHAYGLYLVRSGKTDEALEYLETAIRQPDSTPRYAYVYAVALDSKGRTQDAIKVIDGASQRWPNHLDLSYLQVAYMDKTGLTNGIEKYLSVLAAVLPDNPQVRTWTAKYGLVTG